jgi:chromosome segregation ATPase
MPEGATDLEALHRELSAAVVVERERVHTERLLAEVRQRWHQLQMRIPELEDIARTERAQAERLQGAHPLVLLFSLLGTLQERRDRERQEAVAAALKLDEARAERALLDEEIHALVSRAAELQQGPALLAAAIARRESWLKEHDSDAARALSAIAEEEVRIEADLWEIARARTAASAAEHAAAGIDASLSAAQTWGTATVAAGGIPIAAAWRDQRVQEAESQLPALQSSLNRLNAGGHESSLVQHGAPVPGAGWTGIAEGLLDTMVSDWSLGSLRRTQDAVGAVSHTVAQMRLDLGRRERDLHSRLTELREARARIRGI